MRNVDVQTARGEKDSPQNGKATGLRILLSNLLKPEIVTYVLVDRSLTGGGRFSTAALSNHRVKIHVQLFNVFVENAHFCFINLHNKLSAPRHYLKKLIMMS